MQNTDRKIKPPTQGMKWSAPSAQEKEVARKEKDDKQTGHRKMWEEFCFVFLKKARFSVPWIQMTNTQQFMSTINESPS